MNPGEGFVGIFQIVHIYPFIIYPWYFLVSWLGWSLSLLSVERQGTSWKSATSLGGWHIGANKHTRVYVYRQFKWPVLLVFINLYSWWMLRGSLKAAGSIRFQFWNFAHPRWQAPISRFPAFRNQSASFKLNQETTTALRSPRRRRGQTGGSNLQLLKRIGAVLQSVRVTLGWSHPSSCRYLAGFGPLWKWMREGLSNHPPFNWLPRYKRFLWALFQMDTWYKPTTCRKRSIQRVMFML